MTWAPYEYQKRIFEILNADPTLAGKVFDRAPEQQGFPYVQIGDGEYEDRGSHTTEGWTGVLTIHVWTRDESRKENEDWQAIIDGLLHTKNLAASGWTDLSFRRDLKTTIIEDDDVTYHGVLRYKLLTGEIMS